MKSGWLKNQVDDWMLLSRNIPSLFMSFFVLSVVAMNLLANKELFSTKYLALDCGTTISWLSFLCMDVLCRRFGPKAAMKVSVMALLVNLFIFGIFKLISLAPGMWGEYYSLQQADPDAALAANDALNSTIGGSWYVVFGSALAMLTSSGVNSWVNHLVSLCTKSKGFRNFALRSFISTGIAQFVDNLVFTTVVSHFFFGWTWVQVVMCSVVQALIELLCEITFSPLGYRICCYWEKADIGKEYLNKQTIAKAP